jgi:SulP family sulfate permease
VLVTFGVTLARDLTAGMVAGCLLAALFAFLHQPIAEEGE